MDGTAPIDAFLLTDIHFSRWNFPILTVSSAVRNTIMRAPQFAIFRFGEQSTNFGSWKTEKRKELCLIENYLVFSRGRQIVSYEENENESTKSLLSVMYLYRVVSLVCPSGYRHSAVWPHTNRTHKWNVIQFASSQARFEAWMCAHHNRIIALSQYNLNMRLRERIMTAICHRIVFNRCCLVVCLSLLRRAHVAILYTHSNAYVLV